MRATRAPLPIFDLGHTRSRSELEPQHMHMHIHMHMYMPMHMHTCSNKCLLHLAEVVCCQGLLS